MEDYKKRTDLIREAIAENSISPAMVANAVDTTADYAKTQAEAALAAAQTDATTKANKALSDAKAYAKLKAADALASAEQAIASNQEAFDARLNAIAGEVAFCEDQTDDINREIDSLYRRVDSADDKTQQALTNTTNLDARLTEAEQAITTNQEDFEDHCSDFRALSGRVDALGGITFELESQFGSLDSACANFADRNMFVSGNAAVLIKFTYLDSGNKVGAFILQTLSGDNAVTQILFDKGHAKVRTIAQINAAYPKPSAWEEITLTDSDREALMRVPTVQPAWAGGTNKNYIYSDSSNGNLQVMVGNTQFLYVSNQASYTKLCFRKHYWAPEGDKYGTVAIPEAGTYTYSSQGGTIMRNGLMSVADKTKLDALPDNATLSATYAKKTDLPDMIALSSAIGARDNIFSYDETNPTGKRAVQGNLLFALTTLTKDDEGNIITEASTPEQIKAALTEFSTKNLLQYADLAYCATHGTMLFDQSTQAYVQVTHNGGGFFNFMELSTAGWNELPKLRYVCIRITEDGNTWQVKRAGNSDRLVTLTEFGSMMQLLVNQMAALDERLTALES